MAERSLRSIIAEIHEKDFNMPLREIARWAGCNQNYVSVTLSKLGRQVGKPGISHEPEKKLPAHSLFEAYKPKPKQANQFCQYVWLDGGKLQRCLQPTKGKTYCPDCLTTESTKHTGSRFHSVRSNGKWSHVA